MKVGIDVDGVLSDTLVAIHRKFPGWDTSKGWYGGCTKEQFDAVWADAKNTENFWRNIPAVQGLDPFVLYSLAYAHDLYFITDRFDTLGGSAIRQTREWLVHTLGLTGAAGVIVTKYKGAATSVLELDYFIDDKPENCMNVLSTRPACKTYLCTLPHNLKFDNPLLPRIADFNAFAKLILEVK